MHAGHRQYLITFLSNNKIQSNTNILFHRNLTLGNAKLRFFIYDTSISTITCEDAHEKNRENILSLLQNLFGDGDTKCHFQEFFE